MVFHFNVTRTFTHQFTPQTIATLQ